MPTYNYPEDGKVHTRFSELKRCTPGQIDRVISDRAYPETVFDSSDSMMRGTIRHQEFNNEVLITKQIPKCFGDYDLKVLGSEEEISNEIFPGIVLHSTPDVYGIDWVGDFKTVTAKVKDGEYDLDKNGDFKFGKPMALQTSVYAVQLGLLGHPIKESYYFHEIWSKNAEIVGYSTLQSPITDEQIEETYTWLRERSDVLVSHLRQHNMI